jgi:beta-fructofuranosidase
MNALLKSGSRLVLLALIAVFWNISSLQAQSWKLTPENITRALEKASEKVSQDSLHPAYHLTPPAGCMGDPNGGIYYNGWYHIFYGLNPFSGTPGGWYWAHAKSKDLLHWEHFKPGLTPAFDLGLTHVGSGSTIINDQGKPLAFYSASTEESDSMEFWRTTLSNNLNQWHHEKDINPVLTLDHPGLPGYGSFWRDPFVFKAEGRTFMIACAPLFNKNYVSVPIFEAKDDELISWEYKGILFTWPKHEFRNFEVPELRPIGDKWVFLASSDAPVDRTLYIVGEFDTDLLKFVPQNQGILDYSGHYYAQETIQDDQGNLFLTGWIPGWDRPWLPDFREEDLKNSGEYWSGSFAIPRELTINADQELIQQPVGSMKELRTEHYTVPSQKLTVNSAITSYKVLEQVRGKQLELKLEMELNAASFCGLNVLCDKEGNGGLYMMWSGDKLNVNGVEVPVKEWEPGKPLQLHIFIDQQLVEVFVNGGRYCISHKVEPEHIKGDRIALTTLGGHAILKSLEAWKLKSIN